MSRATGAGVEGSSLAHAGGRDGGWGQLGGEEQRGSLGRGFQNEPSCPLPSLFLFFCSFFLNWSITALQCWVSFCCRTP